MEDEPMMTYRMVRTHPAPDELPLVFGGPAELMKAAQENGRGRYDVDEFAAAVETLSSGHTFRQRGTIIHRADGENIFEPCPWPD
jgi:hypothetical protein